MKLDDIIKRFFATAVDLQGFVAMFRHVHPARRLQYLIKQLFPHGQQARKKTTKGKKHLKFINRFHFKKGMAGSIPAARTIPSPSRCYGILDLESPAPRAVLR